MIQYFNMRCQVFLQFFFLILRKNIFYGTKKNIYPISFAR